MEKNFPQNWTVAADFATQTNIVFKYLLESQRQQNPASLTVIDAFSPKQLAEFFLNDLHLEEANSALIVMSPTVLNNDEESFEHAYDLINAPARALEKLLQDPMLIYIQKDISGNTSIQMRRPGHEYTLNTQLDSTLEEVVGALSKIIFHLSPTLPKFVLNEKDDPRRVYYVAFALEQPDADFKQRSDEDEGNSPDLSGFDLIE